jgi:hypothetical protein
MRHFDYADEETVLQLNSNGPGVSPTSMKETTPARPSRYSAGGRSSLVKKPGTADVITTPHKPATPRAVRIAILSFIALSTRRL